MSSESAGAWRRVPRWVKESGLVLLVGELWWQLAHALGLTAWQWTLGPFVAGGAYGLATAITRSRRGCHRG